MKNLIIKIIIFIIPIILISYPLDIFLSKNLKKSNAYQGEFEVWNDIYEGKINSDIAIYGASNAWAQIDPEILEDSLNIKAYNFGNDGVNFWLQNLRHKEYLKNNKQPKYILLTLNYSILDKRKDLYNLYQYMPYMLWNKDIKEYTSSYKGFTFLDYDLPFIRYVGKPNEIKIALKKAFINKKDIPLRYRGYKPHENVWSGKFSNLKSINVTFSPIVVEKFESFLNECKDKNIKVVFVFPPSYVNAPKYIINTEQIMQVYKDYAKNYDLLFLDYSKDSLKFNKEYFHDDFHLNYIGARIFTSKLSHDLKTKIPMVPN